MIPWYLRVLVFFQFPIIWLMITPLAWLFPSVEPVRYYGLNMMECIMHNDKEMADEYMRLLKEYLTDLMP